MGLIKVSKKINSTHAGIVKNICAITLLILLASCSTGAAERAPAATVEAQATDTVAPEPTATLEPTPTRSSAANGCWKLCGVGKSGRYARGGFAQCRTAQSAQESDRRAALHRDHSPTGLPLHPSGQDQRLIASGTPS